MYRMMAYPTPSHSPSYYVLFYFLCSIWHYLKCCITYESVVFYGLSPRLGYKLHICLVCSAGHTVGTQQMSVK